MRQQDRRLLRQEVQELTRFLRVDDRWEGLRVALRGQALMPRDVLLIHFYEDECEMEYGAVPRVRDRAAFEFERSTKRGACSGVALWQEVPVTEETSAKHPTLPEAIRMLEAGLIS